MHHGPPASGKPTPAEELQRRSPHGSRGCRSTSSSFPGPPGRPLEEFRSWPLSYDWETPDRAIAAHGPGRSTPDFDVGTVTRVADIGGIEIAEASVAVLDGMRPHPNADFTVLCELDSHEQQRRLARRDARRETTVRDPAQPALTFEAGMSGLSGAPDLVLPDDASAGTRIARIIQALPR